jgi:phospholipid/cholesterol/gamma-HCH transport system substrate-binding protein
MAGDTRSLEVKVGALILISIGILGAFVLVMSGVSFEKTFDLYVDFQNPGGLQTGAPVRVAGVKVGKVEELQFRDAREGAGPGGVKPQKAFVRAKLVVQEKVHGALHDDADFYVTTAGVLGEQFLSIDPGSNDKPVIAAGAVMRGIDPPRIDLFVAKAYELLDTAVTGIRNNKEALGDIAVNGASLLKNLNLMLAGNRQHVDELMVNLVALSAEARTLTTDAKTRYVDNPKIAQTIDNIDHLSADLQRDSVPLLHDAKETLANLDRASSAVGSPEEQAKLVRTVNDITELAGRANATVADAQALVGKIRKGEGTIGSLVMDAEVYDDLQTMVRDLKHNPWKIFWKN